MIESLRDYAQLFVGPEFTEGIAQGMLALERNFRGPLAQNEGVEVTLLQWQEMERNAPEAVRRNYRFQLGLLRAYDDPSVRRRLLHETWLEEKAMAALRRAGDLGTAEAMNQAERALEERSPEAVAGGLMARCRELADQLLTSIGYKTTVKERNRGLASNRAAFVDAIDAQLNRARWLRKQFDAIRKLSDEPTKRKALMEIAEYRNPGPGGIYASFQDAVSWDAVKDGRAWACDPGFLSTPNHNPVREKQGLFPYPSGSMLTAYYDTPVVVKYERLDPKSEYTVRIRYLPRGGALGRNHVRATASQNQLIHDFQPITSANILGPFAIPLTAYRNGTLELMWTSKPGEQGAQILELWIESTRPQSQPPVEGHQR